MDTTDHTRVDTPEPPTSTRSADVLLWGALPHLQLNIAQTADLCGVSVRQLGYWSKQGYVAASGRGARRMYGLDALRHVLAIKNAMAGGLSLRQALRLLPEVTGPPAMPQPASATAQETTHAAPAPPTGQERDALVADLARLFAANPRTRDDASGLAVKVGRSSADIRDITEMLCSQGVLSKTVSQGSVVFEGARKGRA